MMSWIWTDEEDKCDSFHQCIEGFGGKGDTEQLLRQGQRVMYSHKAEGQSSYRGWKSGGFQADLDLRKKSEKYR